MRATRLKHFKLILFLVTLLGLGHLPNGERQRAIAGPFDRIEESRSEELRRDTRPEESRDRVFDERDKRGLERSRKITEARAEGPEPVHAAGRVPDASFWKGKRVLVTGDTGAKGSVMVEMLLQMGAKVYGFGLEPPGESTHPENASTHLLLGHDKRMAGNFYGDITDEKALRRAFRRAKPDVVFHLAAIAAVEDNASNPRRAIEVNAEGTERVLKEIQRAGVKAAVMVTTDKVYAATNSTDPLREVDALATRPGHPYALGKAGAAQRILEHRAKFPSDGIIVEVRAGNIIGNDFTKTRLVPKAARAAETGDVLGINPDARRPWLHVYDAIGGYLIAGEEALKGNEKVNGAFNFAGYPDQAYTVGQMVNEIGTRYGQPINTEESRAEKTKASPWVLDTTKSQTVLGWKPLQIDQALDLSTDWYKRAKSAEDTTAVTQRQIRDYLNLKSRRGRKHKAN